MWQHLEESHIEEYRQAKEESKDASPSESSKRKEEPDSAQPTLPQVFQAKNPYPQNSTRWKTLTDAVCLFITRHIKRFMISTATTLCRFVGIAQRRHDAVRCRILYTEGICKSDEAIGDNYRRYWCRKVGHYFCSPTSDTQTS